MSTQRSQVTVQPSKTSMPEPAVDPRAASLVALLRDHWPEYLIEAGALGAFMVAACAFGVLLEHPASPVRQTIADPFVRRMIGGVAMGLMAISIFFSPWGKRSGAHINPAVTLTFLRLGKIDLRDALFYVVAQFAGALAGVLLSAAVLGPLVAHSSVAYAATVPGPAGPWVAFGAELAISLGMMLTVLFVSNTRNLGRYTGLFAGTLVALYITFEAPLSGMSMNPARTLGSALPAGIWTNLWLYFVAPPIGMLAAAQIYLTLRGAASVACAKLHHDNPMRCIFCEYHERGRTS
jgi:aquaporin Z